MKYFILLLIITTMDVWSKDWCPDKVAVAPILYEKKVQPLFFVAEDLLRDFSYTYKARSSTVFCYISLKHKGITSNIELYPPLKLQAQLQKIFNKKDVSMEDIFLSQDLVFNDQVNKLLYKYKRIREGSAWNIPIIKGKQVKWEELKSLSINEMFADRINKIKVQYISLFGWEYLYIYYMYIAMRLFILSFLVIGFIFIKIKFSKNI